jgi:membrane associated rhomboid family serine protease
MPGMSSYRGGGFGGDVQLAFPPVTPMVKRLLVVLAAAYVVQLLLQAVGAGNVVGWLALYPPRLFGYGAVWELLTYALLHGGLWHLLVNLLGLWMFGGDVERVLGSRGLLQLFLVAVAGGGLAHAVMGLIVRDPVLVVGASAGVLGLLTAFAIFFPDRRVYIFGIFPVQARWFAIGFGAISLLGAFEASTAGPSGGSQVAHLAHLGGIVAAWLYLLLMRGRRGGGRPRRGGRSSFRVVGGRDRGPFDR